MLNRTYTDGYRDHRRAGPSLARPRPRTGTDTAPGPASPSQATASHSLHSPYVKWIIPRCSPSFPGIVPYRSQRSPPPLGGTMERGTLGKIYVPVIMGNSSVGKTDTASWPA